MRNYSCRPTQMGYQETLEYNCKVNSQIHTGVYILPFPIIEEHPNNVSLEFLSRADNLLKKCLSLCYKLRYMESIHPKKGGGTEEKLVCPLFNEAYYPL